MIFVVCRWFGFLLVSKMGKPLRAFADFELSAHVNGKQTRVRTYASVCAPLGLLTEELAPLFSIMMQQLRPTIAIDYGRVLELRVVARPRSFPAWEHLTLSPLKQSQSTWGSWGGPKKQETDTAEPFHKSRSSLLLWNDSAVCVSWLFRLNVEEGRGMMNNGEWVNNGK